MKNYDPKKIELKWQKEWDKKKIYQAKDGKGKKFFSLIEIPYPSGDGLHVGHPRPYIGMDIISRKRRMEGYNVLYPIGWDAFGLPTENYAIKTGKQPKIIAKQNIANFTRQLKMLGISFDWSREINTTDPEYYKWTQWIFLQFFKKGLAYKKEVEINWCPKDKIGLANEEAIGGICDRCGGPVEKRLKSQWMLGITKYAERLDKDLDLVDYPERVKLQQRNWIGKSEGSEIEFGIKNNNIKNCLIVHGLRGNPSGNWFPWLKNNLEKENWKVSIPSLPNVEHPIIEEWNKVLINNFQPNSVVIGHSMGASAVLNLIQNSNRKIDKLILIAPVNPKQNWKELKKKYSHADWDACKKFAEIKFDWNKISKLVNEIIIYYSDNDKYIPLDSIEFFKKNLPKAIFKFRKGMGHFSVSTSNLFEFPEILGDIIPKIKVFTTRADTLFGATYVVLAPEHELVQKLLASVSNKNEVEKYIADVKKKTDLERVENKIKTGVELKGIKAINPANNDGIPIWVADYVLPHYGTGAVMAVPAHDERDFEFTKKYNLPIKRVIESIRISDSGPDAIHQDEPIKIYKEAIFAIVKHWSLDKYLCIKWKNAHWQNFMTGGIEKGESVLDAAKREVMEESGYINIKNIKDLEQAVHSRFYHEIKGWNQQARFHSVYIELGGEEQNELSQTEKDLHDLVWLDKKEVENFINVSNAKYAWRLFQELEPICFVDDGILVNSGEYSGLLSEEARKKITEFVGGKIVTKFKLRDWVFSRQRYWGEPIPLIHCEKCGWVSVQEKDLPVKLPEVKSYKLTDTGESPLAEISKWVNTKCPKCGGKAKRETDTMPNWAGSSWYYLRYADPKNRKVFANKKKLKYWTPVDWYNGGMEHTTLHLLYSRFWHKFLYDLKLVPTVEPYKKRTSHGMILAEGGVKMSKSKGNVVNPDEIVKTYGADTLRIYEMFLGPFEDTAVWNTESIIGSRRFIEKVWRISENIIASQKKIFSHCALPGVPGGTLADKKSSSTQLKKLLHKTIKKVSEDIESMHFNTAISAMMILAGEMESFLSQGQTLNPQKGLALSIEDFKKFLQILAPFAPHTTEEIWNLLGEKKSINLSKWPKWDENLIMDNEIKIAIQVNGKVRTEIMIQVDESDEDIKSKAVKNEVVLKFLDKEPKKVIYVKNRLVNIVV